MSVSENELNGLVELKLENEFLRVTVLPELGGKISSIFNKKLQREFLWRNPSLTYSFCKPGSDYELNFTGGIDELLPNDIPEVIMGITYPDHGELWTTKLSYDIFEDRVICNGLLPISKLRYVKEMSLENDSSELNIRYKIKNESSSLKVFMWKLHAALKIEEGSRVISKAKSAMSVYGNSKKDGYGKEFSWPLVDGRDASAIPMENKTLDFYYLYNLTEGNMSISNRKHGYSFMIKYDLKVFPFQWYFGSYGGFRDHYVAILEPSSSMPVKVNEAMSLGKCSKLSCGQEISTVVKIHAGEI